MSLYKTLLKKKNIETIKLPFKIKKEQKELEMEILKLEQQLAKDELTIQEQKSKSPIDWTKLINAIDSKALNDRKLLQLQSLKKELFLD